MSFNQVLKLNMVLDADQFQRIFSHHDPVEMDGKEYIDQSLAHKGITVLYRNSQYKKKVSLIVSPDLVLKGKGPDPHKFVHKLEKQIAEYFGSRYTLDDFLFAELTLTADLHVGSRDTIAAYIRVLQRVGKVKRYSPVRYKGLGEDSSFCLDGNSNFVTFLIYDLRTALKDHFGDNALSHRTKRQILEDTNGILRAEVRLTASKAIHAYSNKGSTSGQIVDMLGRDKEIFMSVFAQIVPYGDLYKKDAAVEIIRQKVKDLRLRQRMLRLIALIPEKKSVLLALKALNYRESDKIRGAFAKIGLPPATISKRHDVKCLKSLYSFL